MFTIEHRESSALTLEDSEALIRLCDAAYGVLTRPFFEQLCPGDHLLGRWHGVLVSHLMWVTRWLQPGGHVPLKTAYVEMVATHPEHQRQGYATRLLEHAVPFLAEYPLAALCPATEGLYSRVGWRFWRGPLSARKDGGEIPTPEERVMILVNERTPTLDLDAPISVEWRPGEVW